MSHAVLVVTNVPLLIIVLYVVTDILSQPHSVVNNVQTIVKHVLNVLVMVVPIPVALVTMITIWWQVFVQLVLV